jgi:hypothetical protein
VNIDKAAGELITRGFAFMTSDEWTLNAGHPAEWAEFTASRDRLALDTYMKPGDTYRERRFCKYVVNTSSMSFDELDDFVFYQSAAINSYAYNLRREFSAVEPAIRKSKILLEIFKSCLQTILLCNDGLPNVWSVYVHQFRINCSSSVTGQPAPEGLHRDGHDFVSMHLMDRPGAEGESAAFATTRALMTVTLRDRLDGSLIDDKDLMHGVSPITAASAEPGHRDMLVIDYNREE